MCHKPSFLNQSSCWRCSFPYQAHGVKPDKRFRTLNYPISLTTSPNRKDHVLLHPYYIADTVTASPELLGYSRLPIPEMAVAITKDALSYRARLLLHRAIKCGLQVDHPASLLHIIISHCVITWR